MDFNEHQLDWARLRIFQAHSLHTKKVEWYDNQVLPTQQVKAATKKEKIEQALKGNMHQVRAIEKKRRNSTMPIALTAFEDKKVIELILSLPREQQCWLRYAYSDQYTWKDEAGSVEGLWNIYTKELKALRRTTKEKLKGLTHLCVQDYKSLKNSGESVHKPARLRELIGASESNWRRDWSPRWRKLQSILAEIDHEALATVLRNPNLK